MNMTVKDLESLFIEEEIYIGDVHLTLVERGDWISEHKSESCELIFTDGTKFYRGFVGRSGSYFNGYTYDSDIYGANDLADIDEVEKQVISVEKWVCI